MSVNKYDSAIQWALTQAIQLNLILTNYPSDKELKLTALKLLKLRDELTKEYFYE